MLSLSCVVCFSPRSRPISVAVMPLGSGSLAGIASPVSCHGVPSPLGRRRAHHLPLPSWQPKPLHPWKTFSRPLTPPLLAHSSAPNLALYPASTPHLLFSCTSTNQPSMRQPLASGQKAQSDPLAPPRRPRSRHEGPPPPATT